MHKPLPLEEVCPQIFIVCFIMFKVRSQIPNTKGGGSLHVSRSSILYAFSPAFSTTLDGPSPQVEPHKIPRLELKMSTVLVGFKLVLLIYFLNL